MNCTNHPDAAADAACIRCRLPYCPDCLVPIRGQTLCGTCKPLAIRDMQRRGRMVDRRAEDALVYALIGVALCGPVLQPMAAARAIAVLREHRGEPGWKDRWKAVVALSVASAYCALFLFALVAMLAAGLPNF